MPPHPTRPLLLTRRTGSRNDIRHLVRNRVIKGHKDLVDIPEAADYEECDERPDNKINYGVMVQISLPFAMRAVPAVLTHR